MLYFIGGHRPCIALRGKHRGTARVQGAQGLHQWLVLFGFGDVVKIVGIGAQIDELGRPVGVSPGHD